MQKRTKTLGNPVAVAAASELLKDKDVRDDLRSGVKQGASIVGSVIKWSFIGVGGVILFFVAKKVISSAMEKHRAEKAEKQETKAVEDTINKDNLSLNTATYNDIATKLYAAFHATTDDDYQEDAIKAQLNRIGNNDDWKKVQSVFGSRLCNELGLKINLKSFLGRDGWYDRGVYNDILRAKGVEESELISAYGG